MSVHATPTFEDAVLRTIYEHVERRGAVTIDDLVREVRIDDGPAQSKPPRLGTYGHQVPLSPERLREAVETLVSEGHLTERDGTIRVALSASSVERDLPSGPVRLRTAREEDRDELLATMREVASEGPYVVGEDVAERVEREPALVRRNDERSRAFFVAVRLPDPDESGARTDDERDVSAEADGATDSAAQPADEPTESTVAEPTNAPTEGATGVTEPAAGTGDVVGWLHVEAPELPSLRHTGELTVGVHPDHRREGIGSHLLAYGLEWADEAGYRKCCQRVPATNDGAIEFLEANGWEREGVREEQYRIDDEYVDEVLLARWT